jgi:hypothetical protein
MGEPSETQILRRLRHRATGAADAPTSSHNLYLDVDHVELEFDVNPREMPPYETGEMLLLCYTATVHDSFPLLDKRRVMSEFYAHYSTVGSGRPTPLCDKMRGTLNLVFAIGAVYSHLINATWQADGKDPRPTALSTRVTVTSQGPPHISLARLESSLEGQHGFGLHTS